MHSPISANKMTFGAALQKVQEGYKVTRHEWDDPGVYVLLRDGFLSIKNDEGFHRLLVSEGDMIGKDWAVVLDQVEGEAVRVN